MLRNGALHRHRLSIAAVQAALTPLGTPCMLLLLDCILQALRPLIECQKLLSRYDLKFERQVVRPLEQRWYADGTPGFPGLKASKVSGRKGAVLHHDMFGVYYSWSEQVYLELSKYGGVSMYKYVSSCNSIISPHYYIPPPSGTFRHLPGRRSVADAALLLSAGIHDVPSSCS